MEHLKEELVSVMCHLEGSLYCFTHSVIAVSTHCAGVLQFTRQVSVWMQGVLEGRVQILGDYSIILTASVV
jgi:hypothetical protein